MDMIENVFREIDSLSSAKSVNSFVSHFDNTQLSILFWKNREIALTSTDALEQRKARAKCQYLCFVTDSSIPCSKRIKRFESPLGLRNIFIDPYARLGTGCIIFPNVVIGANTLPGSKKSGFPTIGNNVYIGAGASVIGGVTVGDNARIGANCVVVRDVPANAVVVSAKSRTIQKKDLNNIYISSSEYSNVKSAPKDHSDTYISPYSSSAYIAGISPDDQNLPYTVRETCALLGQPLPEGVFVPSDAADFTALYSEGISGFYRELQRLNVQLSKKELEKCLVAFNRRSSGLPDTVLNPTNYVAWLFDWLLFSMDRGHDAEDYLSFELYKKGQAERDSFLNIGYRHSITRIANNDRKDRRIFGNKGSFNKTFAENVKRKWLDSTSCSFEDFRAFIAENETFFVKPIDGTGGYGVNVIRSDSDTAENLFKLCRDNRLIVEQVVRQHAELAKFNASTTNTARVYTLRCADGTVRITMAAARFGRAGRAADNFHQGGYAAVLDPVTGVICSDGMDRAHNFVERHPDSNVTFRGFQYPEWDRVVEAVKKAGTIVSGVRHVGWDVTVTENGDIEFIEGNSNPNIHVTQVPNQKGHRYVYEEHIKAIAALKGIDFPQSEAWCR